VSPLKYASNLEEKNWLLLARTRGNVSWLLLHCECNVLQSRSAETLCWKSYSM